MHDDKVDMRAATIHWYIIAKINSPKAIEDKCIGVKYYPRNGCRKTPQGCLDSYFSLDSRADFA